jgi:hypothetical protein
VIVPTTPIAPGTAITGKVSWFGGPNDPSSGPTTASGSPIAAGGIAVYNHSTLGGYWRLSFPNGRTVIEKQTDIGPAPWTGRAFDVAYSSLAGAGYSESDFPTNATVKAVYLGKSPGSPVTSSPPASSASSSSSSSTSSTPASGTPGWFEGIAVHGMVYLAVLVAGAAMLWLGFKTAVQPRKRPQGPA